MWKCPECTYRSKNPGFCPHCFNDRGADIELVEVGIEEEPPVVIFTKPSEVNIARVIADANLDKKSLLSLKLFIENLIMN